MQLILVRALLTRRLPVQKVCPKAIQSIARLAAIIKRRSVLRGSQPAKLQPTPCVRGARKDANLAVDHPAAALCKRSEVRWHVIKPDRTYRKPTREGRVHRYSGCAENDLHCREHTGSEIKAFPGAEDRVS